MFNDVFNIYSKIFNKFLFNTIVLVTALFSLVFAHKIYNKISGIQKINTQLSSQTSTHGQNYAELLSNYKDSLSMKENHLDFLSKITGLSQEQNLLIKSFPQPQLIKNKSFFMNDYTIELEGKFVDLVQWIDLVERKTKLAKVASCSFYLYQDYDLKSKVLRLKINLRNLINNEN